VISSAKRIIEAIPALARQAVPLNGIFGIGWQPGSAIVIYWVESVLMAAVAVGFCWRLKRQLSDSAIIEARAAGALAEATWIAEEQRSARTAGVDPMKLSLFFGASLAVFGVFIAFALWMLASKGAIDQPFDWNEVSDAATAMAIVIAISLAIDLVLFPTMSVAAVQGHVNACLTRWGLLWTLGFVGTALIGFTGNPVVFLWLFAVLKAVIETLSVVERALGWRVSHRNSASPHRE
jgi:hypothetical protein